MTEEEYFFERLDKQIGWYDDKSMWNQKWYTRLKRVELILSALIPVAVPFTTEYGLIKIIIAIAGSVIAIITGIHGLYNFHENWIQYRSTCEILKREKYMYQTRSGIYSEAADPFRLLVERAENIISHENINWTQIQKSCVKRQEHPGIG